MDKKQVENLLIKQLKRGLFLSKNDEIIQNFTTQFNFNELEGTNSLIQELLKLNGFHFMNFIDFSKKIKSIFNIEIKDENQQIFFCYPISELKNKELIFFNNNDDFYISKLGFLSALYFIPELINYEKDFPKVSQNSQINFEENITYWNDLNALKTLRKKNIQKLVARNCYLFNDDKSYVTWLIAKDGQFIEKLVRIYGYDIEVNFNKYFLNLFGTGNLDDDIEIGYYLFYKTTNNIEIRTGLLNTIKNHFEEYQNLIVSIKIFCNYLLLGSKLTVDYSDEDIQEIFAYLSNEFDVLYLLEENNILNFMGIYREFVGTLKWEETKIHFQDYNYFGLDNLNRMIQYTDKLELQNFID